MINVIAVPVGTDNLCFLVHRSGSKKAALIDATDSETILAAAKREGLEIGLVLNTHHHGDHIAGNKELSETTGAPIWCSAYDQDRIPEASRGLRDDESFLFDAMSFTTLNIPGHTLGQVAFHCADAHEVFVGDTVFAMGCGRLLEGKPEQMKESLERILALPGNTRIRFGHEYTKRNAEFAIQFEPSNRKINERRAAAQKLAKGETLPAPTIDQEKEVNPFFRTSEPEIRASLKKLDPSFGGADDLAIFTRLRELRNQF